MAMDAEKFVDLLLIEHMTWHEFLHAKYGDEHFKLITLTDERIGYWSTYESKVSVYLTDYETHLLKGDHFSYLFDNRKGWTLVINGKDHAQQHR